MILAAPEWLYAGFAVLGLLIVMVIGARRHRQRLAAAFSGAMLAKIVPMTVRVRRTLRDAAVVVGLLLAVLAVAEPLYGEKVYQVARTGVDIVLVIDLSRSMDCQDVDPTRLERARREVSDLLDVSMDDRIGIVGFAGGAFALLPLTEDHEAVRTVLGEIGSDTFQTQGSALGDGVRAAVKILGQRKSDADQAILVIADGEVHDPADALAAADEAKAADVRIFAIGVGDRTAPVPGPTGQYLRDPATNATVQSTPSDAVLIDLARRTGGAYVHSVAAADDVHDLYRDEIRARLGAEGRGTMQQKTHESGFQVPLSIAFGLLLGAAWLGDGRRAWGAAARLALIGVLALASVDALASDATTGDEAYRAGRYAEAVDVFDTLVQDAPADPGLWDRLGSARFKAGDFEGAARAWEQVSRLRGGDADAEFNAGNAHYAAHRLEQAFARYQQALSYDPDHPGATNNSEVVLQEIEARRKNQPPPPPENDEGKGEPAEPKDGGGEGDPSEGDPKESKKDPKPGDPSDQTPTEDPDAKNPTSQQQAGRQGQNSENGQETEDEREAKAAAESIAPGDLQPGDPSEDAGAGGTNPDGTAAMSAAQAEKLLEGVEEGHPRLLVQGTPTAGKPW